MKLLFVTNHFIDSVGGGSFASRAYINAFAELFDDCKLLYPFRGKLTEQFINNKYDVKGVNNRNNNVYKLIDIYIGKIHRFTDTVTTEVFSYQPDVVVFDNSRCSAGLVLKIKALGIKVITIHHNFEALYYQQASKQPFYYHIPFMFYIKQAEKNAVLYSDINFTLTRNDAILLKSHYAPNSLINIENLGCFEYEEVEEQIVDSEVDHLYEIKFIITGSLSTYQTENSLIPFLTDYYPKLIELYPISKLYIAGKEPSEHLQNLCKLYENIILVPNPSNINEYINQADIYICPISMGSGLKLRIMDAFRVGLPVIVHQKSVYGYEIFLDNDCLFPYENVDSFLIQLKKIVQKVQEQKISKSLISRIYYNNFSFNSGVQRLKKFMHSIIAG